MAFTLCFCFCLHAVRRAREREGERSPRTQTARTPFSLHKACLDTPFHCNVYSSHFMFLQLTVYCKHWLDIDFLLSRVSVCTMFTISCNSFVRVLYATFDWYMIEVLRLKLFRVLQCTHVRTYLQTMSVCLPV